MPVIKKSNFTAAELAHMREAGRILASLYNDVRKEVVEGVSGLELNHWFEKEIKARGAHPTYKDPDVNFPGVICISPNDTVVHGVPTAEPLQKGDIVSFDLVIDVGGMKADSAFTMLVNDEKPTGAKKMLLQTTERSLYAGIDAIDGATKVGDIGAAVQEVLEKAHLGVIRDLVGHGIGRTMHEDPDVPNYGRKGQGVLLPIGNAIAIEPMATLGGWRVVQDSDDGWTIRTKDGSLAAHFEHTVLLTEEGAEIITKL